MAQSYSNDPILTIPEDDEEDLEDATDPTTWKPSCLLCNHYNSRTQIFNCGHSHSVVQNLYGDQFGEILGRQCQKYEILPPIEDQYAVLLTEYQSLLKNYADLDRAHTRLKNQYFDSVDTIVQRSWWQRLFGVFG
jgi:hypothetical protein